MLKRLRAYPSDIAQAAVDYLLMLESKNEETYYHREVLFLFIESLKYSEDGFIENDEGEFLLSCHWSDIWGGALSGFLDYWFQDKLKLTDDTLFTAPDILRDWVQWCFDKGYFELRRYQDFMRSLPIGKSGEMKRLHRASVMLKKLHSPELGQASHHNVLNFIRHIKPKVEVKGYMKLVSFDGVNAFFKTEAGGEIGPVMMSLDLVHSLRKGDVLNMSLGKVEKSWRVLESGNVYGSEAVF